jgi:hypothetical protein
MPYAIVEDVAANWESYVRSAVDLEQRKAEGLILHAAGRTDEGVRIIEVWESADAWHRFAGKAGRSAGGHFADAPRYYREFTPTQLVIAGDRPDIRTEGTHA